MDEFAIVSQILAAAVPLGMDLYVAIHDAITAIRPELTANAPPFPEESAVVADADAMIADKFNAPK